jgi:hypothetical protein
MLQSLSDADNDVQEDYTYSRICEASGVCSREAWSSIAMLDYLWNAM